MKKTIATILTLSLILSVAACSQSDNVAESSTSVAQAESEASDNDSNSATNDLSEKYELIFTNYSIYDKSIDDRVERLLNTYPDMDIKVYDANHYSITMNTYDYTTQKEQYTNHDKALSMLSDMLSDSIFNGSITNCEFDEESVKVIIYVDNALFNENFSTNIMNSVNIASEFMDSYQAYNLVSPEDRTYNIEYLDKDTGEMIELG